MKVSLQEIIQQLDESASPFSLPLSLSLSLAVSGREQLSPTPVLSSTELTASPSSSLSLLSFSLQGPNEPLVWHRAAQWEI